LNIGFLKPLRYIRVLAHFAFR